MYPSRTQYRNAVLNGMFPLEKNGGYTFQPVLENNQPVVSSGGNAIVFKVADGTEKEFALKLFSDEVEGRFKRLQAISQYLEKSNPKYFTHFQFIPNLIYVEIPGQPDEQCFFPGVVMNWINGETLDIKIGKLARSGNKDGLRLIAEKFRNIALSLLKKGIAHGDLKLSNILVNENDDLFLIDYDGMYLPELSGQEALENGTPSYQHPKRSEKHFDLTIDHFSILNIYTSLQILADLPFLFDKHNDGDNLLFTKEDFEAPKDSELLTLLKRDAVEAKLLFFLEKSLTNDTIGIEYIGDIIQGKFPEPNLLFNFLPEHPVEGQTVTIAWEVQNADFIKLNGIDEKLIGTRDITATQNQRLVFEYGTAIEPRNSNYFINTVSPPTVIEFLPSNLYLKFDEPLTLFWKVEHTKKVLLKFEKEVIDVSTVSEYDISKLEKDTVFTLELEAMVNEFKVSVQLLIKVFYPIRMKIVQERAITFMNKPVKLCLEVENAEQVILSPGNYNLTDKREFEFITANSHHYRVVASNMRYSEVFEGFIDILKPRTYDQKIIELPTVYLKLPEFSVPLPPIHSGHKVVGSFERKVLQVTALLDKFNIFKISLNRQNNDREK